MKPWDQFKKPSSVQSRCEHRVLASGPAVQIEQCVQCRNLTLHMGALSIRLQPAAAESLWATLGEALHALREQSDVDVHSPHVGRA